MCFKFWLRTKISTDWKITQCIATCFNWFTDSKEELFASRNERKKELWKMKCSEHTEWILGIQKFE